MFTEKVKEVHRHGQPPRRRTCDSGYFERSRTRTLLCYSHETATSQKECENCSQPALHEMTTPKSKRETVQVEGHVQRTPGGVSCTEIIGTSDDPSRSAGHAEGGTCNSVNVSRSVDKIVREL